MPIRTIASKIGKKLVKKIVGIKEIKLFENVAKIQKGGKFIFSTEVIRIIIFQKFQCSQNNKYIAKIFVLQ